MEAGVSPADAVIATKISRSVAIVFGIEAESSNKYGMTRAFPFCWYPHIDG
jgi:hypothetical protein